MKFVPRILFALFLASTLAFSASAQETSSTGILMKAEIVSKKKSNKFVRWLVAPWKDKKLLVVMGIVGGAMAADMYTTARVRDTCPTCKEGSLLLHGRPSNKRLILTGTIALVVETYAVKELKKTSDYEATRTDTGPKERWIWERLWMLPPLAIAAGHTGAAKANSNIFCEPGMIRTAFGCKTR